MVIHYVLNVVNLIVLGKLAVEDIRYLSIMSIIVQITEKAIEIIYKSYYKNSFTISYYVHTWIICCSF